MIESREVKLRVWIIIALVATIGGRAGAETSDKAMAEALFKAGREGLARGHLEEACAKFTESQRLEPKLGTLLNLALCHEKLERTASAWAEFTQARSLARALRRPDHEAFAEQHLRGLSDRLSIVRIDWQSPTPGESVALDGVTVGAAAMNTDLPVDPGEHIVQASAPDHVAFEMRISVARGPTQQSLLIPVLNHESLLEAPAVSRAEQPKPIALSAPARPRTAPPRRKVGTLDQPAAQSAVGTRASRTPLAIAALLTGGAAIAVGSWAGLRAFSSKRAAQRECDGAACSQRGLDLYSDVRAAADLSTVAFVVGIAALGCGTWLWVSVPSDARGSAGLALGGKL
jgi:hypothetical protein